MRGTQVVRCFTSLVEADPGTLPALQAAHGVTAVITLLLVRLPGVLKSPLPRVAASRCACTLSVNIDKHRHRPQPQVVVRNKCRRSLQLDMCGIIVTVMSQAERGEGSASGSDAGARQFLNVKLYALAQQVSAVPVSVAAQHHPTGHVLRKSRARRLCASLGRPCRPPLRDCEP